MDSITASKIVTAVSANLSGAEAIAIVPASWHDIVREDYEERAYIVAWRRSVVGTSTPSKDDDGFTYATHRVHVNSQGRSACFDGHYDQSRKAALADMNERAGIEIPAAKDPDRDLAVWYTPDAIREHFSEGYDVMDADDEENSVVLKWVKEATDDELREVGSACLGNDSLWREFHHTIDSEVRWAIFEKHKGDNHPGNVSGPNHDEAILDQLEQEGIIGPEEAK